jgi:hypothetical protein
VTFHDRRNVNDLYNFSVRSELGSSVLELQNLLSSLTEVGLVQPDPVQVRVPNCGHAVGTLGTTVVQGCHATCNCLFELHEVTSAPQYPLWSWKNQS